MEENETRTLMLAGQRKLAVINMANRVFVKVQAIVSRDKYSRDMTVYYSVCSGPNEYVEVIIETPDLHEPLNPACRIMHRWPAQLLLDLAGDADMIIERKVLSLLQTLFAQARGVPSDE